MLKVIEAHQPRSHLAIDLVPKSVASCFPSNFLQGVRVVVSDEVPSPPFEEFGLPGPSPLGDGPFDGITLGSCYFVRKDSERPDLHFHELVHIVQWQRLDPARFLQTYGVGLLLYGYRDRPLESLAYHLQLEFLQGILRKNLVGDIQRHADVAWEAAQLLLATPATDASP